MAEVINLYSSSIRVENEEIRLKFLTLVDEKLVALHTMGLTLKDLCIGGTWVTALKRTHGSYIGYYDKNGALFLSEEGNAYALTLLEGKESTDNG